MGLESGFPKDPLTAPALWALLHPLRTGALTSLIVGGSLLPLSAFLQGAPWLLHRLFGLNGSAPRQVIVLGRSLTRFTTFHEFGDQPKA
jgi:hypothetical protein